jgi:hypothetical protein
MGGEGWSLEGMRYAPNDKCTQGADKETSHEEE